MEIAQGRPDAGRLSGADRQGRRTSRSRSSTSPRSRPRSTARACAGWSRCSSGRAQVPREEHPRPAEDGGGLHAARHGRGAARADRRGRARPRLPRRAAADRRRRVRAPRRGRPRPPDADRATRSRAWPASILAEYAAALRKLKDTRGRPKDVADDVAAAAAAPGAQALHRRHAVGAAAAPAALPEGDRAAARQAARRPGARRRSAWPSCGRSSSATCGSWPSARARATRASRSSAGCSRSCASSLFAQELSTPQPVSVKRLDKIWAQAFA